MLERHELLDRVRSYDPYADEGVLGRAYDFSMEAHGSQRRASGAPYFSHPVEVADILTRYRLDTASIATALLHDTVEDTVATILQIRELFGSEIARLVDGVTKLSELELRSNASGQAENFRKLLLAISEDVRVLLVKLADRLHNMRTLHHVPLAEKRSRIARETMDIYAPLAGGIGIQEIKEELEDLAFRELHPQACESVSSRLDFLRQQAGDIVERISGEIDTLLADAAFDAVVSGRVKRPVSIWRKMQRKDIPFERLTDIIAFRVVVASVDDCYRVLGKIHSEYRVIHGEFDDYISTPKKNGYQSLHTAVIGPGLHRIEIQIRTTEMDRIAEFGVAAHWLYKHGAALTEGRHYHWVRKLIDLLESSGSSDELLEDTRLELYPDQVFCFTPKGDIIGLPQGATSVDFAYAVHSEVGDRCVGVRINGKMMPLRTPLANGDQIEVLTSPDGTPSPTWERWAVTGKARARIRRHARSIQRDEFIRLGRALLDRVYRVSTGEPFDSVGAEVLARFGVEDTEALVEAVGRGDVPAQDVVETAVPPELLGGGAPAPDAGDGDDGTRRRGVNAIPIRNLTPGMAVHYADCCDPMPGEEIVGALIPGRGISIHTRDCETLVNLAEMPERWVDVAWDLGPSVRVKHRGRIDLVVTNRPGTLSEITALIAQQDGNISNLKITGRSREFFRLLIDFEIESPQRASEVVAALRTSPAVSSVNLAAD